MCAIESPVGPACDVSQPSGDTADALEQNVLQMMLQQLNFTSLWGDFSRWIIPEAVQLIQVFFLKMLGKECIFLVIFFLLTKPFQAVLLCCALEKGEQKKNQEKCVKQQSCHHDRRTIYLFPMENLVVVLFTSNQDLNPQ